MAMDGRGVVWERPVHVGILFELLKLAGSACTAYRTFIVPHHTCVCLLVYRQAVVTAAAPRCDLCRWTCATQPAISKFFVFFSALVGRAQLSLLIYLVLCYTAYFKNYTSFCRSSMFSCTVRSPCGQLQSGENRVFFIFVLLSSSLTLNSCAETGSSQLLKGYLGSVIYCIHCKAATLFFSLITFLLAHCL